MGWVGIDEFMERRQARAADEPVHPWERGVPSLKGEHHADRTSRTVPPSERDRVIVERYFQGVPVPLIGRAFGITPQRVYQILGEQGATKDRRRRSA